MCSGDDKRFLYLFLKHTYLFCSIIASILIFASVDAAVFFYSLGASSGYVAFGVATAESISLWAPVGVTAMIWALLFPITLLTVYILSLRKHDKYDKLICILVVVDTLIVVTWVLYAYISGNEYGGKTFLADAIVSVFYTVAFLGTSNFMNKKA